MKFKTTNKEVRNGFSVVLSIGYCNIQHLLNYETPVAYTTRKEGWASDIYDVGRGVAISTRYAPVSGICVDRKLEEEYDEKALKIITENINDYDNSKKAVTALLKEFVNEVLIKNFKEGE